MKVAIIGGGLSGIVCAIQLQRYGIKPHVFEKKKSCRTIETCRCSFRNCLRSIKDPEYLNEKYNIFLKPSGLVNSYS